MSTTVSGNIQDLSAGSIGNGFVRFWLRGTGGNQPRVNGSAVIAPTQGGSFYFDVVPDNTGAVSGSLYSTRDSAGTGDGDIEVGGSKTAVWYGMQAFFSGKPGPEVPIHAKSGATFDISNVTPLSTNPIVVAPTGDTTYARLDGGNQPFVGDILPQDANSSQALGSLLAPWVGVLQTLNAVAFADTFAGGSVAAKINAAVASFGSDPGILVIPSTMAAGEGNQYPDNIAVIDLRATDQDQGIRFNLPASVTGNVRSKIFIGDIYNGASVLTGTQSSAALYVNSAINNPESSTGSLAAINGTMSVNSQGGNATSVLIGGEFTVNVTDTNGTARTCSDIRGVLGNCNVGGNSTVTQAVSVYAQAPAKTGSGVITNAYSVFIEPPTVGSTINLGLYNEGKTRLDGNVGIASSVQAGTGLFLRSGSTLSGGTQIGIQSAPVSQSDATTEGSGMYVRCDTAAASFTQTLNTGIRIQAPTFGSGSTVTTAIGLLIESITGAGTNLAIETQGSAASVFGGEVAAASLVATGATPTTSSGQVGIGTTSGFGNGSSGTAVTTTTKSTGSGPTTPQTIVKYLEIDIAGTKFWVPLTQ